MCPSCLSGGIGVGYIAAFVICGMFFIIAFGVMFWAGRSGKLDGLEQTKYSILND